MAKVLLNGWESYASVDRLADLLTDHGVTCEKKRNGNIWVKQNEKTTHDFFNFHKEVHDILKEYGDKPKRSDVDYTYFDHESYYTADDGGPVIIFSPYSGELSWPALIEPLWEKGYYVAIYDRSVCLSHNCIILVRKRKDKDKMFKCSINDGPTPKSLS